MMKRKWVESKSAQMNIDFLAGISVFLISFLLIVQLVPNIFIPLQGQSVALHSVAYRTGVILCEDPGWYNGTINVSGNFIESEGYNWEAHPDNVSRIGLADNKFSSDFSNPLTISVLKITTLAGLFNSSDPGSYDYIQKKLGLITSYRKYNFNISLIRSDNLPSSYLNQSPILLIGKSPPSNIEIEKIERIVSFNMNESDVGNFSYDERIDNQIEDHALIVNLTVPISAFRIYIESRNLNLSKPLIQVDVKNETGTYPLLIQTNYSGSDMPVIIDLAEDFLKYDDSDHKVTIDIQYNNTYGYYYYSYAGDLVGDKLAGKIVIQVW